MTMNPEEFRIYGKQAVDWIADFLQNTEKYPVLAQVKPGDIKKQLPTNSPVRAGKHGRYHRGF